jgi:hypothetical protein
MEQTEFDERKIKLMDYVEKSGIDREEVEKHIQKEYLTSMEIGMNEGDSRRRSIVASINYYRKYIDKLGNRAKFLCLGASQPTDFGLSKKVTELRKRLKDPNLTQAERDEMVFKKIITDKGIPLHTADTTSIEDKRGSPINVDDEMSQNLVGIIDDGGKLFPAIVKVYGKKGCEENKPMYTWGSISGEQSQSPNARYPGYIVLNTREPNMTVTKGASRIKMDEYKKFVQDNFSNAIMDLDDTDNTLKKLEEIKSHVFIKNAKIIDYSFNTYGIMSGIKAAKDELVQEAPVRAEMKVPGHLSLDVDPAGEYELWLLAVPRVKRPQDKLLQLDLLGMYVENPQDLSKYKMKGSGFIGSEEAKQAVGQQSSGPSVDKENLMRKLNQQYSS